MTRDNNQGHGARSALKVLPALLALAMFCQGCVVYEPVPAAYVVSSYDMAFDSAVKAAQDVGIGILTAERQTGNIYGTIDSTNVHIIVARQADGKMRIEFNLRGGVSGTPKGARLGEDFYRAYDWHMGRR